MYYNEIDSPLGKIVIACEGNFLCEVHLETDRYFTEVPKNWQKDPGQEILIIAENQFNEYFLGQRNNFEIPLSFSGTELQNQTWQNLTEIPFGKTISYKELASRTNKPKAIRAVASAVGKNPLCIIVPCHRVIASDGTLGGYGSGIDHKLFLLQLEKESGF